MARRRTCGCATRPSERTMRSRPCAVQPRLRDAAVVVIAATVLAACATRPVNPPIVRYDPDKLYRMERPSENAEDNATLVILAFSGGGTRAAAFSYGALETLRELEVT